MRKILVSVLISLFCAVSVNAASIAMNFIENKSNQDFVGGELIGPTDIDSSYWNSSVDAGDLANDTLDELIDDSGTETTASVTWTSRNAWYNSSGTGSDEAKLTVGFLDDGNGGATITVSDIPYEVYNVYVLVNMSPSSTDYFHSDVIINGVQYFDQGGYFPVHAAVIDGTDWIQCDGVVYGNYIKVEGEIGSELVIDSLGYVGGIEGEAFAEARGGIAGFVIEEVPVTSYNRMPINRDKLIPLDQTLRWEVDENVTSLDLYVSEDPNFSEASDLRLDSVSSDTLSWDGTGVLEFDKEYFWRIDTYDAGSQKTTGYVTSFRTQPATPVIENVVPALVAIPTGNSKTLSVSAVYQESFQWYKDGISLVDNELYSGTTTDTLTIVNMQSDAVGVYTCSASNAAGSATTEAGCEVVLGELLVYYPFDEVMVDPETKKVTTPEMISGFDMTLQNKGEGADIPEITSGIVGDGALTFDNSNGNDPNTTNMHAYAQGFDFGNKLKTSITIEFWAAMSDEGINSSGDTPFWASQSESLDERDPRAMNIHLPWGSNIAWNTENGNELTYSIYNSSVPLGSSDWHYWVFTKDSNSGEMAIYIDGEIENSKSDAFLPIYSFKWIAIAELNYFTGSIDDMKIYNYARTADEIAQDYMNVTGAEYVCDNRGSKNIAYDFDNNCKVDILDFATFVSTWLNDNRIYSNK